MTRTVWIGRDYVAKDGSHVFKVHGADAYKSISGKRRVGGVLTGDTITLEWFDFFEIYEPRPAS